MMVFCWILVIGVLIRLMVWCLCWLDRCSVWIWCVGVCSVNLIGGLLRCFVNVEFGLLICSVVLWFMWMVCGLLLLMKMICVLICGILLIW